METIDFDFIKGLGPCYDPGRYLSKDWRGTALDILSVLDCPAFDRLWVVFRGCLLNQEIMKKLSKWLMKRLLKYDEFEGYEIRGFIGAIDEYFEFQAGDGYSKLYNSFKKLKKISWESGSITNCIIDFVWDGIQEAINFTSSYFNDLGIFQYSTITNWVDFCCELEYYFSGVKDGENIKMAKIRNNVWDEILQFVKLTLMEESNPGECFVNNGDKEKGRGLGK